MENITSWADPDTSEKACSFPHTKTIWGQKGTWTVGTELDSLPCIASGYERPENTTLRRRSRSSSTSIWKAGKPSMAMKQRIFLYWKSIYYVTARGHQAITECIKSRQKSSRVTHCHSRKESVVWPIEAKSKIADQIFGRLFLNKLHVITTV